MTFGDISLVWLFPISIKTVEQASKQAAYQVWHVTSWWAQCQWCMLGNGDQWHTYTHPDITGISLSGADVKAICKRMNPSKLPAHTWLRAKDLCDVCNLLVLHFRFPSALMTIVLKQYNEVLRYVGYAHINFSFWNNLDPLQFAYR